MITTYTSLDTGYQPRRHRRGLLCALALGLLIAGITACETTPPPLQLAVPDLAWRDCGDGVECASAEVPLDYDHPDGRAIRLAVGRLPATDPDRRIGSLFVNRGGPGLTGLGYLRAAAAGDLFPAQVRERFDIVAPDPRGVGKSTPVRCFASSEEQASFGESNGLWPTTPDEVDAFVDGMETLAAQCADANGDLLDHLSTANVARDLDLLRQAVGDERMNYFGKSYGTYLGVTYASMFPDQVRAMVLDGVAEPVAYTGVEGPENSTPWLRAGAHLGATQTLEQFFDLCAGAGERCALGVDGDPREKFEALVQQLITAPLSMDDGDGEPTELGADDIVTTTLNGLYAPASWADLAALLQSYVEAAARAARSVQRGPGAGTSGEYDNSVDAQFASVCVDAAHPRRAEGIRAAVDRALPASPYGAARWGWGISGVCPFWAGEDDDRYTGPFDAETADPVLVVGTRFDPATPYGNAEQLVEDLPNAVLLGLDGWGHTAAFAAVSSCIDAAVTEYLVTVEMQVEKSACAPDGSGIPFAAPPGP